MEDIKKNVRLHSLSWRFKTSSPSKIKRQFKKNYQIIIPDEMNCRISFWHEPVNFNSNSLQAEKLSLRIQQTMFVQNNMHAILLEYSDNVYELIIACNRHLLSTRGLQSFMHSSIQGIDYIPMDCLEIQESQIYNKIKTSDFFPTPNWNLPETTEIMPVIPPCLMIDGFSILNRHEIITGALIVLSRYTHISRPVLAIGISDDNYPQNTNGLRLITAHIEPVKSIEKLCEEVRCTIEETPFWMEELSQLNSAECENGGKVSIALIFLPTPMVTEEVVMQRYIPLHDSDFYLTLLISSTNECGIKIETHANWLTVSPTIVKSLLKSMQIVCQRILDGPDLAITSLPLVDPQQVQKITSLCRNDFLPGDQLRIEQYFHQQVLKNPSNIAISHGHTVLTYQELDKLSEKMAKGLITIGVAIDDKVGICLEKTPEFVITMLAILKSGATYVPMDPQYPTERLCYICENAGLKLVVTDINGFPQNSLWRCETPQILLKTPKLEFLSLPSEGLSSSAVAYVIYTSGSTGKPKGVAVPHKNICNLIASTKTDFELSSQDIWTFFHSAAFDFSVWEIWGALLTGAEVVVVPYWISRSPEEFHGLMEQKKVTILNQTPSAFTQFMIADASCTQLTSLRLIIFGGEPLDTKTLLPWFDRYPESSCRVVNMFGITETTVHVTSLNVTRLEAIQGSHSVGRVISGWRVYILDESQHMTPIGVEGEIYVGGSGVALGYLNQPGLTSERFIEDIFCGGVMYKSGDRGRLLPDGTLEHLGRMDNQIKLRGFRIELDEIRKVMLSIKGVTRAAVVLNKTNKDDEASARLECFVVLLQGTSISYVIESACGILPQYMMPAKFIQVDDIPLTPNGKIDNKKLIANDFLLPKTKSSIVSNPVSIVENEHAPLRSSMQSIWQDIMGCQVDVQDNFFELGGNSLIAVRIAAAMKERGLVKLSMQQLYIHQSIDKLVTFMEGGSSI